MSAIAAGPAAFEIRIDRLARERATTTAHLHLRDTGDGCSLMSLDGTVLFRGFGLAGRRHCLEFARSQGVLAVFS